METEKTKADIASARGSMISNIHLENFIHFGDFTWDNISDLNVIIGENDTGKTKRRTGKDLPKY